MKDKRWNKFKRYLQEKMRSEEDRLFEDALTTDTELASTFKVYSSIKTENQSTKNSKEEQELKNSLQLLNERYFKLEPQESEKTTQVYINKSYLITTALAIALVIILFIIFNNLNF